MQVARVLEEPEPYNNQGDGTEHPPALLEAVARNGAEAGDKGHQGQHYVLHRQRLGYGAGSEAHATDRPEHRDVVERQKHVADNGQHKQYIGYRSHVDQFGGCSTLAATNCEGNKE